MEPAADIWEILIRLSAAVACGALLGFEREAQNKPAGLRTHMMVALGSAAFTLIALELAEQAAGSEGRPDPTRVVQGIVGGIGFLGAGSILQSRGGIRGITTAAGIWVMGAIGVACGGGEYVIAVVTAVFAVTIMGAVLLLEGRALKFAGAKDRGHEDDAPSDPSRAKDEIHEAADEPLPQDSPPRKAAGNGG